MSEEAESEVVVESASESEEKARAQGWVPKDDYKGDPAKWRDADAFLEVGSKINAVQKERNEKLTSEVLELKKTMQQLVNDQQAQKEKAVEKAIKALKAERAEAINQGDGERVNAIDDQIDATKEQAKASKDAIENPDFKSWHKENEWYLKDKVLTAEANDLFDKLTRSGGFGNAQEVYDTITSELKDRFPNKFKNPNREEPSTVERNEAAPRKKGKTFADLPSDAKAACEKYVRDIPGYSREKYLATYEWD